eukprot:2514086-Rhodomonas_salina.3
MEVFEIMSFSDSQVTRTGARYGKPKNREMQDIHPVTWTSFKVPPSSSGLVPWGRLCDQYDWPDQEDLGAGDSFPNCHTGSESASPPSILRT